MIEQKKHIEYLDVLKGIAIFLVIAGHSLHWEQSSSYSPINDVYFNLINIFHVPIFFWVSGFLLVGKEYNEGTTLSTLWRRFYTLIVPLVTFSVFNYIVFDIPFKSPWFLGTLFEAIVINTFYEFIRFKYKLGRGWDFSFYALAYIGINIIAGLHNPIEERFLSFQSLAGQHYLVFCFGCICRRYDLVKKILDKNIVYSLSLLIFSSLFISCDILQVFHMYGRIHAALGALSGVVCIIYICKNTSLIGGGIKKFFTHIGKYSLELYLLHGYFKIYIPGTRTLINNLANGTLEEKLCSMSIQILSSSFITILNIGLCLIVLHIIRTSNIFSILFLGRKNNN